MEKVLFETSVTKSSTCFTYVLDRVNSPIRFKYAKEIPEHCFVPLTTSHVEVGEIVVWKNSIPRIFINTAITNDQAYPLLIQRMEDTSYHFGVVERVNPDESAIISDCTRGLNDSYFPEIRLRLFDFVNKDRNEVRIPDYKLKLNNEKPNEIF